MYISNWFCVADPEKVKNSKWIENWMLTTFSKNNFQQQKYSEKNSANVVVLVLTRYTLPNVSMKGQRSNKVKF